MALARAAAWGGGLETGFGTSGAAVSRDLTFTICAAAAWAPAVLTLVLIAHNPTIDAAVTAVRTASAGVRLPLALALAAGAIPALAQPGKQDGMRQEYSGRYLLLFEYAAMLRLITVLSLLSELVCPFGMARAAAILTWPAGLVLWAIKLLFLCMGLALLRITLPGLRTFRLPAVLAGAALAGIISAILLATSFPGAP